MKNDTMIVESTEEGQTPLGSMPNNKIVLARGIGYEKSLNFQDNSIIEHTTYDAEPFLKSAAEAQATGPHTFTTPNGEKFVKAGTIPMAELGKMIAEGWVNDDAAVKRWFAERPKLVHDPRYIKR